jgi:hypothetical protein
MYTGEDETRSTIVHPPVVKSNWFFTGFCFGSMLYVTQAVFGDLSLVSRWVVAGYPNPGPMPYPWG